MSLHGPSYLLPENRKIRHLRGISLRNLTFARPRGRTIDDGDIQRASDGHAALRPAVGLPHAHSSDSLHSERTRGRRITLSGVSAHARQRLLEQAFEHDTADAFFSLHYGGGEPIYVSEVEAKATNFNFRIFDLSELDPHVSRGCRLTVRVWMRRAGVWTLLIDDDIDLRLLSYIGSSLQGRAAATAPGTAMHFAPNSIVLHLVDGIYIFGGPVPAAAGTVAAATPRKQGALLPTSSYAALMRLASLENSLQDLLATRDRLAMQIDAYLASDGTCGGLGGQGAAEMALSDAEARLRRVLRGGAHQRRGAELARQKRDDLRRSLGARRAAMAAGRALQQKALEDISHAGQQLAVSRATAQRTANDIRGQRRRVCEDLLRIFGVEQEPAPSAPLSFRICGLPLPNTDYGPALSGGGGNAGGNASSLPGQAEEVLSAALGFAALLTNALQGYLAVVLPYGITPYGSRTVVRDDISKIPDQQREFPLHLPRGGLSAQYRFDYAWFLLNKDIETLCSAHGLKVVDIRHTLPNLKYLLYVCSAGSTELPQRKRGGVRGLLLQRQPTASRASSVDGSEAKEAVQEAANRTTNGTTNGTANGTANGTKMLRARSPVLDLPFSGGALTLRTKGLRENVDGR